MEQKEEKPRSLREAGMMICVGSQGVGKTYRTAYLIYNIVRDNIETKVKGKKCLIFDTNGEFGEEQFAEHGIKNFKVKKIAVKDVGAWCRSNIIECRRIDAKTLKPSQKKMILDFLIGECRNCLLVLEDMNTYLIRVTNMEDIVGGLVNLRHKACDVVVSFQRLRAVEPLMYANCRWIRLHYQKDKINPIKEKVGNDELFSIARLIIEDKYHAGNKRFFLFIMYLDDKLVGQFSKNDFKIAAKKYLNVNKKIYTEYADENEIPKERALEAKIEHLVKMYYGNDSIQK